MECAPKKVWKVPKDRQNYTVCSILRGRYLQFTRQNINIDRINKFSKFCKNLRNQKWITLQKVIENSKRSTKIHFLFDFTWHMAQLVRQNINIDRINNFPKFSKNLRGWKRITLQKVVGNLKKRTKSHFLFNSTWHVCLIYKAKYKYR